MPVLMHLFAYGTLMDPEIMHLASKGRYDADPATLVGYVRKTVTGEVYPAITESKEASVTGVVYFDVSVVALERLDAFEGSLYRRTLVTVTASTAQALDAYAYILSPAHVARLSKVDWSYEAFLRNGRSAFLRTHLGIGEP